LDRGRGWGRQVVLRWGLVGHSDEVSGNLALVGFYGTLQWAGPVMILAPILGAVGLTLVTVSHLIPIAMSYELVPAYLAADPGRHATRAVTGGRLSRNSVIFRPPR
jgi:hypothetical protein